MTFNPEDVASSSRDSEGTDQTPNRSLPNEEDSPYSAFSSPRSRVQGRGQIVSGSPLISNKSDPSAAPERTFDNTPIQGFKNLDEVSRRL
ncbi:hypothetical protein E3N88_12149 [Mikania micrantha]|uniref:Uncharacterized protein n=1 Tax=Mikania micrantha TaxID=192012 RepID=A0A5N6P4P0_9ASTR|nr:hypothetical protein E3N88_12149 [Mikania micrantha]